MACENHPIFQSIHSAADGMQEQLTAFRRDLHRYPELGWMEMRTSSLIARKLVELGCDEVLVGDQVCDKESRMGVPADSVLEEHYRLALENGGDPEFLPYTRGGMTGVVGILRCGEGPVVGMRFDIDALPIQESDDPDHYPAANGFRSVFPGVMHACGHDGHAATGVGTAAVLCALRDQLHGTVKFIFQPSEEGVRGAKSIVAKGHLEDVQYLLGAHMGSDASVTVPTVGVGTSRTLATTKMDVTFHGKSAHAGFAPEAGNNAMLAMATAVLNLQAIPRYGKCPTRINVGRVTAGVGRNVICDRAVMEMEVRGLTSEANDYMADYARRIIAAAAQMHNCTYDIRLQGEARGDCNSQALMDEVKDVCRNKLRLNLLEVPDNQNGGASEDYSFMSSRMQELGGQSCYFMNLNGLSGPIHHPRFDFQEEALVNGVKAFAGVAADLLIPD